MPASKNQTARYFMIDKCLGSRFKTYWSLRDLLTTINKDNDFPIEERTLKYDIENLRYCSQLNYNAPIKYSKREDGYYYTDPDYSIKNLALNDADIAALEFATSTLNQYKEINIFHDFTGAVDKVLNVVSMIKDKNSGLNFPFIDLEKAPYCKGTTFLDSLVSMIRDQQVVEIVYKKFTDTSEKKHIIHPYLLKEYRNRWYLLGWNDDKDGIITLGLDRIVSVKRINLCFVKPQTFTPDLYFKNTLGVTYISEQPVQEIVLSFQPLQGKYIKTQPIHESQEIIKDDESECIVKLHLIPNYELKERILGYGSNVKVLQPKSFKTEIADLIAAMHGLYSG